AGDVRSGPGRTTPGPPHPHYTQPPYRSGRPRPAPERPLRQNRGCECSAGGVQGSGGRTTLGEPGMTDEHTADVVRLAAAASPAEAHIWQQALRDEGIRCRVVGDYLDYGYSGHPGQTAEVWVRRADRARAEEVLRQRAHALPEEAAGTAG